MVANPPDPSYSVELSLEVLTGHGCMSSRSELQPGNIHPPLPPDSTWLQLPYHPHTGLIYMVVVGRVDESVDMRSDYFRFQLNMSYFRI